MYCIIPHLKSPKGAVSKESVPNVQWRRQDLQEGLPSGISARSHASLLCNFLWLASVRIANLHRPVREPTVYATDVDHSWHKEIEEGIGSGKDWCNKEWLLVR